MKRFFAICLTLVSLHSASAEEIIFSYGDDDPAVEPLVEPAALDPIPEKPHDADRCPPHFYVPAPDRHARAGCPQQVSKWARHTYGKKYTGYYVGGGVSPSRLYSGERRYPDEGTWGMDYDPWYSRVRLLWSHGFLYQGGTGQYEPDRKNNPFHQIFGLRFR